MMDPIGLALEYFDVTGRVRIKDNGVPIDAETQLYDGTPLSGPADLSQGLLNQEHAVVRNFIENVMAYALGRRVEYFDMPSIRAIEREAADKRLRDGLVHHWRGEESRFSNGEIRTRGRSG